MTPKRRKPISSQFIYGFNFKKGDVISGRYKVVELIGKGTEGEVYKVTELFTHKERAAKFFFPQRNIRFETSIRYAKKLDKLKDCPLVMDYVMHDVIEFQEQKVGCLVSEYIHGELLSHFIKRQKQSKVGVFPATHLLYTMLLGIEAIHQNGEYHGDLHVDNIIIRRIGLEFDLKVFDFHHWGDSKKDNREEDVIKIIRIFYDMIGGAKMYSKLPKSIKSIICGLKRQMILSKFKSASELRVYLENMDWSDAI